MTRLTDGDEINGDLAAHDQPAHLHLHAASHEVSTGSPFADALVQAMNNAGAELKRLHAENEQLTCRLALLTAFARKVMTLDDMFSPVLLIRVAALHDLQREAGELLKDGDS